MVRAAIAIAAALSLAFLCIRSAFVEAFARTDPAKAALLWPSHPAVVAGLGMTEIGAAAAQRRDPAPGVLAALDGSLRNAPLSATPLTVRGVAAQAAGDLPRAERLLREAAVRAPREAAPHYFLAQHYLATNRAELGLRELAILSRLLPGSADSVGPGLAAYARSPGAVPALKSLFARNAELKAVVLATLAADAANADLVLALAELRPSPGGSTPPWLPRLLQSLIDTGHHARARSIWAQASGVRPSGLLFDPTFAGSGAPPPFNWTFAEGSAGLAEPGGQGLHILYYGREDAVLAGQTLVLPAGRYRLAMRVASADANSAALAWRATCLPSKAVLLALHVAKRAAVDFTVPPSGCGAQQLSLAGQAGDVAQEAEATIAGLSLQRVEAR